jgi:phosphate-selective porin OprO/OprP
MRNRMTKLAGAALVAALAALPAAAEDVKTDMSKGGITFSSGPNSLTIGGRLQGRFTADDREDFDADPNGTAGFLEEDGLSRQFAVQRMRLTLKGGMWKPWLRYEFQFELASTSGANDNKVKDAVIEIETHPLAVLKVGQYKAPFSLQELTSSGRQQFVDRAITNAKFAPGRDQGVMLGGLTERKKFGYAVGAFNGSGESRPQEDQGLLYVGRVWFDPLGEYRLSESANDHPEKNVLHVGLGARTGEAQRGSATGAFEEPDDQTAFNLELAWRYRRFHATGEYFVMEDETTTSTQVLDPNGNPTNTFVITTTDGPESSGFHVQGGVMVVPRTVEVGLRYAQIDPDDDLIDDKVTEARAVFGWYFQGHNLKVQADAGRLSFEERFGPGTSSVAERGMPSLGARIGAAEKRTDVQYRVQMQVAF